MVTRRSVLIQMGVLGTAATGAGCLGTSGGDKTTPGTDTNEVAAGPNGNPVFDPESIEISVGETVTWTFESMGHNVSARPKDGSQVKIPDGTTPFASFEGDKTYKAIPKGETYSHTFKTAGTYTYVCIPHITVGMIGNVVVSE